MIRYFLFLVIAFQHCSSASINLPTTDAENKTNHASKITLENNGYTGILIAIADSVKEDENLLDAIQDLFIDASSALFTATDNRAFFKEVTILVPQSWKNVQGIEVEAATTESLNKANIRIEKPTSINGNNPWTRQVGGCGDPGQYMMLSPEFITSSNNRRFGSAAKMIVHEWGHLRWGLFDEYPIGDNIRDHFYNSITTGELEPTRCSRGVRGMTRNRRTGEQCKLDPLTSMPEADCRFYENDDQTKALGSLMYSTSLTSVTKFCGDEEKNGEGTLHNYQAPTLQNLMCSGRSSWSIMKEHPDFNNANFPTDSSAVNRVAFKFVQKKESRIVIAMDISRSMNTNRNFVKLHSAVSMYLNFTVAKGTRVGLVKYNNTAYNLTTGLRKINNQEDRDYLMNLVPKKERKGGSAIGLGLRLATKMLEEDGADAKGSRIIIYTDGDENIVPTVDEVMPEIIAKGIIVDAILISPQASDSLKILAAQTGGVSFYASGHSQSTSLLDAFTEIERSKTNDPMNLPVTVYSEVHFVRAKEMICRSVAIDDSLGRDTLFLFSWTNYQLYNNIRIFIANNTSTKKACITDQDMTSAAFKCNGQCDTGIWEVCIDNNQTHAEDIAVQVESKPRRVRTSTRPDQQSQYPITLRTKIVNSEPDFNNSYNRPVWLFATVTRGYDAVVGAKVVASIENPAAENYTKIELKMRDDGLGADMAKEDGTYSAYIVNSKSIGKHAIFVEVTGVLGTKVKSVTSYSRAPELKIGLDGPDRTQKVELIPTDKFQRYSLAGYIDVQSVAPEERDMYPPARILDLKVTRTSRENQTIALEWTAVGDDLDKGKARSYEVWTANNTKQLYLANETKIDKLEMKMTPREAYSKEKAVITVSDPENPQMVAIVAYDHHGKPSQISNIVSARLKKVPKNKAKNTGQSNTTSIGQSTTGSIIGLIVGLVFCFSMVVL